MTIEIVDEAVVEAGIVMIGEVIAETIGEVIGGAIGEAVTETADAVVAAVVITDLDDRFCCIPRL